MATSTNAAVPQVVGKVFVLYGTVKAVAPDGTVRILAPNSPIYANEQIITGSDGSVSIQFTGPPVTQLDLGRMTEIVVDEDVYAGVAPEVVADAAAEAEKIQETLLAGDEEIDLEATAAGGDTGAGGGHSVVIFDLDGNVVTPGSGADTTGINLTTVGTLSGVAPTPPEAPPTELAYPEANPDSNETREGLEGTNVATVGNVLENDLSGDGAIIVTAVGGSADNVGVPITTDLGGTITINPDGSYSYIPPAQADHSQGPVLDTITYTITNSDGNSATSTLTIDVADTEPLAVDDSGAVIEDGGGYEYDGEGPNDQGSFISGNVLDNDIDSADVPKAFVSWGSGDADQAAKAELAKYGTLTLNADGSYALCSITACPLFRGWMRMKILHK